MQSEKKYKTKASQEYKRHLTKSLQEGLVGNIKTIDNTNMNTNTNMNANTNNKLNFDTDIYANMILILI